MRSVMNAQQMRDVDRYMIETLHIPGLVLMENAAMGTAQLIMQEAEPGSVVHVFCGTGNNGGDGLACARVLMANGYDVYVVIVGDPGSYKGDALSNYKMFEYLDERVLQMRRLEDLYGWRVPKAQVIVDAIFGTGLSRDVSGVCEDAIEVINKSSARVVSVDMPSGVSADNGRVLGCAVRADVTATFQYPKLGQYLYPGREHTGDLHVIPIGVDAGVEEVVPSTVHVYESDDPDMKLHLRSADSNKGTYGRLFVVAGSRGMAGAAVMCAQAAYAAGAGLVTVGAPESIVDVVQISAPEATCLPLPEENGQVFGGSRVAVAQAMYRKTAMAIGPGLGLGEGLKDLVTDVVEDSSLCRVVDADALNALDNDLHILAHMKGDLIFTPHPAEFARLLGTELGSILEHPLELASAFARKCGVVLVLKGATTIVADTDGSVTLVAAGTPGMAKGGSGDVLTGVIAGFAAQGFSAHDAAVMGVYYCAMAGERAARELGEYSMTPMDTLAELGTAIGETCTGEPGAWKPAHVPSQIQARAHQAAAARPAAPVAIPKRTVPRPPASPKAAPAPEHLEPAAAPETAAQVTETVLVEDAAAGLAEEASVQAVSEVQPEADARELRRLERQRQQAEREQVRARLREHTGRTAQPGAAPVRASALSTDAAPQREAVPADTAPHSRAEAARQAADQANDALTSVPRRTAGGMTGAEKEARRQSTAAHAAVDQSARSVQPAADRSARSVQPAADRSARSAQPVDQSTRVAPSVTQQGQRTTADTTPEATARSEAQRHRDELNAQIQKELKKQEQRDKPVQRTRRRIG